MNNCVHFHPKNREASQNRGFRVKNPRFLVLSP